MELNLILKKYLDSYKGLPQSVWMLSIMAFTNSVGKMVITFLALFVTQKLGQSVTMVGKIMMAYGFGCIIGGMLSGKLCDYIDSRKVIIASLFLTGIGFFILSITQSIEWIILVIFFVGFSESGFRPAYNTTISRLCPPKNRARAYSLYRVFINVGCSIGAVIGGFLSESNFSMICQLDGLTSILAAMAMLAFYHKLVTHLPISEEKKTYTFDRPWKDPVFLLFCIIMMGAAFVFFQIKTTYPLYLRDSYEISNVQFGLLMSLNGIIILLFEMPLLSWTNKFRAESMAALGAFLLCFGFALLPVSIWKSLAFVYLLIWTTGEMIIFPTALGIVANQAPESNRGEVMGIYHTLFSLSHILAPVLGSLIYAAWSPEILWAISGLIGIVISLGFYFLPNIARKLQSSQA